jgi:hypothetical protein
MGALWRTTREICPARFDKYSQAYGPDPLDSTAHYHWNAKVSGTLLPTLTQAEILLRNAVDRVMVNKRGALWFDSAIELLDGERKALSKAKDDARRKENARRRPSNHDDIVVELSFRFWTNLLQSNYSRSVWNHLLVYRAFPNIPAGLDDKRREARLVFCDACDIRNRVCHGERVVHLPNLKKRHAKVLKAIGWMNQPMERITRKMDAFPDTWENGLARCRETLLDMIPDPPETQTPPQETSSAHIQKSKQS